MTSLFRTFLFAVLGLAFAAFGIVHGIGTYPAPETLVRFSDALPTLSAVLSFALAILAILIGLALLIPTAIRLMRQSNERQIASSSSTMSGNGRPRSMRQSPARCDGPEEWSEEYEGDGMYAQPTERHPGEPSGRYRRNGEFDDPRRASVYR